MPVGIRYGGYRPPLPAPSPMQAHVFQPEVSGAGLDAYGYRGSAPDSYMDPLPEIEFQWTSDRYQVSNGDECQDFRLTFNSWSAGGWEQRGGLELMQNFSKSSLVTKNNRAILPFKTNEQTDIKLTGFDRGICGPIIHTTYRGRMVVAAQGAVHLYAETSTLNQTLIPIFQFPSGILSISKVTIGQGDYLAVGVAGGYVYFIQDLTVGAYQQITVIDVPYGLVQVPLPREPIVIRSGVYFYLVSSESIPNLTTTPAAPAASPSYYRVLAVTGSGGSSSYSVSATSGTATFNGYQAASNQRIAQAQRSGYPIGVKAIGGRPTRIYWREFDYPYNSYVIPGFIASTSLYGADYARHNIGLETIYGADFIGAGIVSHSVDRVNYWEGYGGGEDLRIFDGVKPEAGYVFTVAGLYTPKNQLFADVCLVPTALAEQAYPGSMMPATNVKTQRWRYEFGRDAWSPVSRVYEWAPDVGVEGGFTERGGIVGHLTAYGLTSLASNATTGRLWTFPGQSSNPMLHKYQEIASVDPFGLRDTGKDYESSGEVDSPVLLFPGEARDKAKVFKSIDYGGQDTGGTSSKVTWYVAEGGHLDATTPGPLKHEFKKGLSEAGRHHPFPTNMSPIFYPQFRMKIDQGSDTDSTPEGQVASFTGYVNFSKRARIQDAIHR